MNAATVSPQYAAVTPTAAAAARSTNGGTVYLTTDYITYREYYNPTNGNNGNGIQVTNLVSNNGDQYHTVRQHLTTTPSAQQQQQVNAYSAVQPVGEIETSFLDRYLRSQPLVQTSSSVGVGNLSSAATSVTVSPAVAVASLPSNGVPEYHTVSSLNQHLLTVDLPSPDSGLGDTSATPRPDNASLPQVSYHGY